jgi:hypothetical protein
MNVSHKCRKRHHFVRLKYLALHAEPEIVALNIRLTINLIKNPNDIFVL